MEIKLFDAKKEGEMDYDIENDIIFFKVKNREYKRSIELDDLVLDLDDEGHIIGIQIFGVSKLFDTDKESLQNIHKWQFRVKAEKNVIFIQLKFEMLRGKKIIEYGQNLVRETSDLLTDSEVMCAVTV